jgi:Flp pilus assembly protein TadG
MRRRVWRLQMPCRWKNAAAAGGSGRARARAPGLWRARAGVSSIEFALTAPLMLILLMPVVDLGMGFYQQMQVSNAAEAGAQYVMQNGFGNLTAIESAVTSATTLSGISASPAPTEACGCPNSTNTAIVAATCGSTCPTTSQTAGVYVTVNAEANYTPLLSYPVLGSSRTLTAQSVVRIPCVASDRVCNQ